MFIVVVIVLEKVNYWTGSQKFDFLNTPRSMFLVIGTPSIHFIPLSDRVTWNEWKIKWRSKRDCLPLVGNNKEIVVLLILDVVNGKIRLTVCRLYLYVFGVDKGLVQ